LTISLKDYSQWSEKLLLVSSRLLLIFKALKGRKISALGNAQGIETKDFIRATITK
jgi:hypothetical protein